MTLKARVARVDDYSGELAQALSKLEMENDGGTLNKDEQVDFIRDLYGAVYLKDIKPWRSKFIKGLLVGILLIALSRFLPATLPHGGLYSIATLLLASVSLVYSCFALVVFLKRGKRETNWLRSLEASINKGGTIFERT